MDPTSPDSIRGDFDRLGLLPTLDLVGQYEALWGRRPRSRHRVWLMKRIAWKAEEARLGGLSHLARQRIAALITEMNIQFQEPVSPITGERPPPPGEPILGSSLCRDWHGREYRATRVEGGWEYEDLIYKSLSALACHITGARWNGRLFFGLTKRKARR